jgi:hypothetical protein
MNQSQKPTLYDDPGEVQRVPQPCCLKKERGRSSSSARAPSYSYMKQFLIHL